MFSATAMTSSGLSSRVSSLMTTMSVSLTDSTKSLCLSGKRFWMTSSAATSERSSWRTR